jgi:hypothetical protein
VLVSADIRTIRPVEGRRMRHPETKKVIPVEGRSVAWNSYWQRALNAGDIELVPDVAPPASAAKASSAAQPAAPAGTANATSASEAK